MQCTGCVLEEEPLELGSELRTMRPNTSVSLLLLLLRLADGQPPRLT